MRVPTQIDVVRWHVKLLPVAALAHEPEEPVIPLDRATQEKLVGEARTRHVPQKRALPPRRHHEGLDEAGLGRLAPA